MTFRSNTVVGPNSINQDALFNLADYLERNGSIDAPEAEFRLGEIRLSDKIGLLKKRGYLIERDDDRYYFEGKKPDANPPVESILNKVLRHLLEHGEITSSDAYSKYNCKYLPATIRSLRGKGYEVEAVKMPTPKGRKRIKYIYKGRRECETPAQDSIKSLKHAKWV